MPKDYHRFLPPYLVSKQDLSAQMLAFVPQMKSLLPHPSIRECSVLNSALSLNKTLWTRDYQIRTHTVFTDMLVKHSDLLFYNDAMWLSKRDALRMELREEIITCLCDCQHKKANTVLMQMLDSWFMLEICFLNDIICHLNVLILRAGEG